MFVTGDQVRFIGGNPHERPGWSAKDDIECLDLDDFYSLTGLEENGVYQVLFGERNIFGESMVSLLNVPNVWRPSKWFKLVAESAENRLLKNLRGIIRNYVVENCWDDLLEVIKQEQAKSRSLVDAH